MPGSTPKLPTDKQDSPSAATNQSSTRFIGVQMPDLRDYKDFLRELPIDQFNKFVSEFGGEAKGPEEIVAWVNSPEREKRVCDKIRTVFEVQILTAAERQEKIAKASADVTKRQATAAEKANEMAEKALRVAKQSMCWTMVAGIVAALAFILSIIGLFK